MRSYAKRTELADDSVWPKFDSSHAVAIHTIVEPTMISHLQIPRRPDPGTWEGMGAFADFRPKSMNRVRRQP